MLQKIFVLSLPILVLLSACSNPDTQKKADVNKTTSNTEPHLDWVPPVAGQVVDKWEKPVTDTRLHNAFFRASVITTDSSDRGHYIIKAEYGASVHEIPYGLPEWNDDRILKPWIQKVDSLKYGCAIGFNTGNNEFRPFYVLKVSNDEGDMDIKQVATYRLSR